MTEHASPRPSRSTATLDLALIIGMLLVSKWLLLQIDAIWTFAGPISLLASLGVAAICLQRRGIGLAAIGLTRPESVVKAALWTILALVVTMGVGIFAEATVSAFVPAPDAATQAIDQRYQGRFENLPGNLPMYLFWLALAWIIGGFIEEVLFRGVMITRFEDAFARIPFRSMFAIMCQAVLFGQAHYYYQGLTGWIANGAIAIVSGILYLIFQRNLWPLMISHGLSNTIGLTLIYMGLMQAG